MPTLLDDLVPFSCRFGSSLGSSDFAPATAVEARRAMSRAYRRRWRRASLLFAAFELAALFVVGFDLVALSLICSYLPACRHFALRSRRREAMAICWFYFDTSSLCRGSRSASSSAAIWRSSPAPNRSGAPMVIFSAVSLIARRFARAINGMRTPGCNAGAVELLLRSAADQLPRRCCLPAAAILFPARPPHTSHEMPPGSGGR